ncbi:MAG: EF-P lysine aminoacylase EpmA [Steroidobacteraceae bacterium]|nr:EF-P lysine aminoacylase GenX [Nevskiaceae bacterium]MCP5339555.1 EF-P lysine aminoacylase GenX [Nevskiaceae bacterium]MCP5359153.1 EF-P lysine aminoacylase GenX [Nevskiaceae bacterium]MCP5466387.1 EF-P lysine aminoacylase GenX [Nevskiaceae bacterium]MCP5471912.1 EF-P lysine aminoacylase GenX [Nevskiaceae bacterium]
MPSAPRSLATDGAATAGTAGAPTDWRPSATPATLRQRARLRAAMRDFFAARGLLEVETPLLVGAPVTDPHLQSARVDLGDGVRRWLHTSPEYAMKRLLAAGSGDIWQACRVMRAGAERGRHHNPEFTLVEWYRQGYSLQQIAAETAALVDSLLVVAGAPARGLEFLTYREALRRHAGVDPLDADLAALRAAVADLGLDAATLAAASRDDLLDLLVATRVGPALGFGALCALTHYPASQAALARLDPADPRLALRFELYGDGLELANGFEELADAGEQAARFAADNARRDALGRETLPIDTRLLAALEQGLPGCAGVAVGFDRVVMLASGATSIDEVLAFPLERA